MHDGPLVSVIIPTFDRPAMLQVALDSIMLQTYSQVETIVVIDGGPRLDALASKYPNVQFIHMPENNGRKSMNTAFAATKGEYVAFLNDDDVFFPHHIASLVTALERSGRGVAHGDVLTAYLRGSDEEWLLYGLESNMSRAADLSAFLVANQIGMTSCMLRRTCIKDGVLMPETVPYYFDYALWLRLARDYDFIHVESITSCYTIRNKGAQQQSVVWSDQAVEAYRAIYDLYPTPDRPLLQRRREERLQSIRRGETELATEAAGHVQPVLWPLWNNVTAL